MDFHLFRFSIWTSLFIISCGIDETQSSTDFQEYYSETYEIIDYGLSVLRTIIFHHRTSNEFHEMMKNIRINNSNIQHLIHTSPLSIQDKYSSERRSGLDYVISILQYIDNEYGKFVVFYSNINNRRGDFSSYINEMYETGFFDIHVHLSLTWTNITDPMDNLELFEALVKYYDPQVGGISSNFPLLDQYIYDLCNKILLGIIKVYSIVMYSTVIKTNDLNGPVINKIIDTFEINVLRITGRAFEALKRSSRQIYKYDPPVHKKGITYDSLDYFLQGYVTDQKYLQRDGICTPMCSVYDDTIHYNHNDSHLFPQNSVCTGRIRSCTETTVSKKCLAPLNSTRRYDGLSHFGSMWERFPFSQYWGRISSHCNFRTASNVSFSEPHCRICSCTCDMVDSPKSIRYVDLSQRRSRSSNSFVITGIRFRIINRILYMQIQEGELRNGEIIAETVTWRQIENTDRDHDNDFSLFKLDYNNRLFDLTELTIPKNYAITMVGFADVKGIIGLQIEGLPINDGTFGNLDHLPLFNRTTRTVSSRPVFKQDGLDIPTTMHNYNYKFSEPNNYLLKFETSDWENDASQNVVPFIDLQEIVTDPPQPLSGIGMHLRYGGKSGGFLALKLISISNEINVVLANIRKKILPLHDEVTKEAEIEARMTHMREALQQANSSFRPRLNRSMQLVLEDPFITSRG